MSGLGGKFLDYLYPKQCLGCDLWFSFGGPKFLCSVCEGLTINTEPILQRSVEGAIVYSRFLYSNQVVAKTVQALKYEHIFDASEVCGDWVSQIFERFMPEETIIVPVPLHVSRLSERGYNQAELICLAATQGRAIPVKTNMLVRTRKTEYQALLNEENRRTNVADVFSVNGVCDPKVTYVIFDDVVTSGSTMGDCARALRAAGAQKIFGVTVASTQGDRVAL
jgi:ComF family protein